MQKKFQEKVVFYFDNMLAILRDIQKTIKEKETE